MYFVIRCNYINSLTNKSIVGFFSELSDAQNCVCLLNKDPERNTVIIAQYDEGLAYYTHPEAVYRWDDYYQIYVPVFTDTDVHNLLIIY